MAITAQGLTSRAFLLPLSLLPSSGKKWPNKLRMTQFQKKSLSRTVLSLPGNLVVVSSMPKLSRRPPKLPPPTAKGRKTAVNLNRRSRRMRPLTRASSWACSTSSKASMQLWPYPRKASWRTVSALISVLTERSATTLRCFARTASTAPPGRASPMRINRCYSSTCPSWRICALTPKLSPSTRSHLLPTLLIS